jgi:hypothetical protein
MNPQTLSATHTERSQIQSRYRDAMEKCTLDGAMGSDIHPCARADQLTLSLPLAIDIGLLTAAKK